MNLDEFDWLIIIAVILGAIAAVVEEVATFVGIDVIGWLVLLLKIIAACLSVIFAVWKFFRLKPFIIDISPKQFKPALGSNDEYETFSIAEKTHKKGKHPSINVTLVYKDGSLGSVSMIEYVDENGTVTIGGNRISECNEYFYRLMIKQ